MKKLNFTLLMLFCFFSWAYAQNTTLKSEIKIRNGAIFLTLDDANELRYFSDYQNKIDKPIKSMTFSLVNDNACNIYAKWMNPLRYKFLWKDTTYVDPRDQKINDFLKLLVAKFPMPDGVDLLESKSITKDSDFKEFGDCQKEGSLYIPKILNDINLNFLMAQLVSVNKYCDTLNKVDIIETINPFIHKLEELDGQYAKDQVKTANMIFKELYNIVWSENLETKIKRQRKERDDIVKVVKEIDSLHIVVRRELKNFKLSGNRNYIERIVNHYTGLFLYNTEVKNKRDKEIAKKLEPLFVFFDNSIKNLYKNDYYRIKTIEFENGKVAESELSLEEFKLKELEGDIYLLEKKTDLLQEKLTFRKYDPFDVWVSTGVLYTNITEKEFGVSNDAYGQFLVTEIDIKKQRTGAAFYLNFKYDFGSRYFAPLIQMGIDPTQIKPFFLLGGGFMLGSNFAITGGPIWTWNPTLSSLKVGGQVNSTTDLGKDIKYEFDSKPKGWYLGIQYNF